jgi:hypothetical protein
MRHKNNYVQCRRKGIISTNNVYNELKLNRQGTYVEYQASLCMNNKTRLRLFYRLDRRVDARRVRESPLGADWGCQSRDSVPEDLPASFLA